MNFYEVSFFCEEKGPVATLNHGATWPLYVQIKDVGSQGVVIHFKTESQWINFKNSVIEAHEKYLKERNNGSM